MDEDELGGERQLWNQRYSDPNRDDLPPSEFLLAHGRYLPRKGKALVVACGTGKNAIWLSENLDVLAIDISEVAIRIAREKASKRIGPHELHFEVADAKRYLLNLEGACFNVITIINYNEPMLVPQIKRILAPGGIIILQIYTPNDERLQNSGIKQKLITESMLFEPSWFGSYWILDFETEHFIDNLNFKRERLNFLARKPISVY